MSPRKIARIALYASLYTVLTYVIAPIAYGPIQLRFTDAMAFLVYYDIAALWGLIIGGTIVNFFSPVGIVDVIVGTICGIICLTIISKMKNLVVSLNIAAVVTGIMIGGMLAWAYKLPWWYPMLTVYISSVLSIVVLGLILNKLLGPKLKEFAKD